MDAIDFLMHFGGFETEEIGMMIESGLTMVDFAKLKKHKDRTRFAARDSFLMAIDSKTYGMQRIVQSSAYAAH